MMEVTASLAFLLLCCYCCGGRCSNSIQLEENEQPAISDGLDDDSASRSASASSSAAGAGIGDFSSCYHPGDNVTYFVVLDAGSTGTRALAHRFRRSRSNSLGFQHIGAKRFEREPGLQSFSNYPGRCRDQLESLLGQVAKSVPARQRSRTCLLLRATAGFRLIDARPRYLLARVIRETLRNSNFLTSALDSTRLFDGTEEAKYTWLAVNYLLGNFRTASGGASGGSVGTKPVIEMGGGSLQLAYESRQGDQALSATPARSSSKSRSVSVGAGDSGQKLRIRARSYLGLGSRESVLRFVGHNSRVFGRSAGSSAARGRKLGSASRTASSDPAVSSSSWLPIYRTSCIAENLTLNFTFGLVTVQLIGERSQLAASAAVDIPAEGGRPECLNRARELIEQMEVRPEPELNHASNQPIYAVSAAYWLLQFLHEGNHSGVTFNSNACPGLHRQEQQQQQQRCTSYRINVGDLAEAAASVCRDVLPTKGPFKPYYCINLALTAAMLQASGMGLEPGTPLVALGGPKDSLSWTLGLSLDKLSGSVATAGGSGTSAESRRTLACGLLVALYSWTVFACYQT